jgi:hypothetical protein
MIGLMSFSGRRNSSRAGTSGRSTIRTWRFNVPDFWIRMVRRFRRLGYSPAFPGAAKGRFCFS